LIGSGVSLHSLSVWGLGFAISCGIGHVAVAKFHRWLTHRLGVPRDLGARRTPPGLTGFLERVFFTLAMAVNTTGVLPTMIAWLALKLAANWQNRDDITGDAETKKKLQVFGHCNRSTVDAVCLHRRTCNLALVIEPQNPFYAKFTPLRSSRAAFVQPAVGRSDIRLSRRNRGVPSAKSRRSRKNTGAAMKGSA
jgi:hypothetical protein